MKEPESNDAHQKKQRVVFHWCVRAQNGAQSKSAQCLHITSRCLHLLTAFSYGRRCLKYGRQLSQCA